MLSEGPIVRQPNWPVNWRFAKSAIDRAGDPFIDVETETLAQGSTLKMPPASCQYLRSAALVSWAWT